MGVEKKEETLHRGGSRSQNLLSQSSPVFPMLVTLQKPLAFLELHCGLRRLIILPQCFPH